MKNKTIKTNIIMAILLICSMLFATNSGIAISIIGETKIASTDTTGSQTISDGIYVIRSAIKNSTVLDIAGGSTEKTANLQIWDYANVSQQKYRVIYLGDGYYTIESMKSSKVLDVVGAGKTAGTNVWQYDSNGSDAQKWIIKDSGDGYYYIISKCNGLYLDIVAGQSTNGTNIQVYTGNGTKAQKFTFDAITKLDGTQSIENGTYIIKSAMNNNMVLDINGASKENGANLQIWENENLSNQRFEVTYLESGYYKIIASHSNKTLDVYAAGKVAGTNVWQYDSNGSDAQKWIIKDAGNGYYYIISKCNGLYLDIAAGQSVNGANVQVYNGNNSNAQKFSFEKYTGDNNGGSNVTTGSQTVSDGIYVVSSAINNNKVLDIDGASRTNGSNLQIWDKADVSQQRFTVKYLGDGYYTITAAHSSKVLDVAAAGKVAGTNVWQYDSNGSDAQKWIIKDAGNGYYYIISKCNGLYLDILAGQSVNGANVQVYNGNNSNAQKFKFSKVTVNIDTSKYPGYKEKIEALIANHPNWNFEFLYVNNSLSTIVAGETKIHGRNLVPSSSSGEWVCSTCGTKLYDSGWYCASEKATAYYMDSRNFLDETNVFQFLDVNCYSPTVYSLSSITSEVSGTFLANYAQDINTACSSQAVNPYYIIARLFQEQGRSGTTIGKGMNGGDGQTYYNPFNIGASGNGSSQIYANALATAKKYGWNTMEKAIEGGITFCKKNWLENYQSTLYQNKFDIDDTNGSGLYNHQYMQNLSAAYSEARSMQSMYKKYGTTESNFTFIIPVYENLTNTLSGYPSSTTESYPMNVKTTGTNVILRKDASTSSNELRRFENANTILLSVQRGVNSNWQKVITEDGLIGYVSGTYLTQIDDIVNCNDTMTVKTSQR